jgi:hypothetical protein
VHASWHQHKQRLKKLLKSYRSNLCCHEDGL